MTLPQHPSILSPLKLIPTLHIHTLSIHVHTDQLNTTIHGTMKKTPFELVFGQPPRQNIFPGVSGTNILEEDVEDILEKEDDASGTEILESLTTHPSSPTHRPPLESHPSSPTQRPPLESHPSSPTQRPPLESHPSSPTPQESQIPSKDVSMLGNSSKHLMIRKEADKLYHQNAQRMRLKYCKAKHHKVMTFQKGDFVSVRIPRIDRTSTDFHRLPCVVVERLGSEFHLYRLR